MKTPNKTSAPATAPTTAAALRLMLVNLTLLPCCLVFMIQPVYSAALALHERLLANQCSRHSLQ